ncbi:hypothetical protein Tco_1542009 [Tanacetum coccineum]
MTHLSQELTHLEVDEKRLDTLELDGPDKVETDYELAQRLQAEEQEELTIEEKSKKFQQLLEKRRKHFAAKRAEERRRWKPKDLKNKSFASVQELFENAMKRVNIFVDMDTELVEGSKIREEESSSKRVEKDVAIDVIPLAIKPAPIVNFQIHRKGRNNYYEIKRADGSAKTYLLFSQLLKEFDREDLENLWKLVKAKHGNTRPEQGYERVIWGDLKTMFEHHIEDEVWSSLQGKKVLLLRLYDSCGVHFVRFEDMHVYMLVEKRYPLTPTTITDMLNKKLKFDYSNEMIKSFIRLFGITAALIKVSAAQEERVNAAEKQAAKVSSQYWKPPIYHDDDDDDDEEYSMQYGGEHLSTTPEKESNKVIKSSVENLVPIPSEFKVLTDYESECDMPICGDSSSKNEGLDDIISIPTGKEIDHLDAIPDSVQSLLNYANSIIFLIEEFVGELAPIDPIPPAIVEADFDQEEDFYSDAIIKSFSPSPIPVEDSDSLMEDINIFLAPDDSIPPGIENDDYDSEGDVLFLEESLNDDSISLPDFDYKMVDDISDNSTRELYVLVPNVLPTFPTLYPVFDTLLPFSSENEEKVFNPGILISKEEKSLHLLSYRGFKVFQLINDSESPMMIYGGGIPILDNRIGVNAGDSKLMLLGINLLLWGKVNAARHKITTAGESINLLLLGKVNAARHKLTTIGEVNAARHNLQLLVNVNALEGSFINTSIKGFIHSFNLAFLAKPTKSEGFEQIVDFLNANPIRYALTINLIIYTSYIEQFWATIKVKTVNRKVQLQALVDGKKIIVTNAFVRHDLQLNDEECMDCLPNATIFQELTRMGAKTTAWNEFSSTMASVIICLATNQKFNFSKYIFESMVKNLDNVGKFFMYPRFVQIFLEKQLERMSSHKRIYVTPSHTKKIFGNMRRVGKGFSRRDTPLLSTMMVQAQQEQGEGLVMLINPQHTPTIIQPSTSQPQLKQRSRRPTRKDTEVPQPSVLINNVADKAVYKERDNSLVRAATTTSSIEAEQDSGSGPRRQDTIVDTISQTRFKNVSKTSNDSLLAGVNTPRSDEDRLKLNEVMEFFTKLQQRVLDLENTKTAQAQEITSLKLRVKKLEKKGGSRTHKLKRLYKVGRSARLISSDEASLDDQEDASKQGRKINDIDKDTEITLVHETQGRYGDEMKSLKSAKVLEKANVVEEPSESITKTPTLTKTTAATTIIVVSTRPKAKGLVIHEEEQATTPTVSSQQPSLAKEQDKGKGIMIEEPMKMKKKDQISLDEELAFKQQAREEKKKGLPEKKLKEKKKLTLLHRIMLELQRLIEVVPDKEEVAIDAIALATKPPSIVDYKIHKEGKKNYYQIIRAMEVQRSKYRSTRPEEGYERVLWGDLKTMFNLHVEDQGRIVGIKRLLNDLGVTVAKVCVTAAKQNTARVKLVLLVKIEENILSYYCLYTVNAASV